MSAVSTATAAATSSRNPPPRTAVAAWSMRGTGSSGPPVKPRRSRGVAEQPGQQEPGRAAADHGG
ncbi:hypothetical protein ACIP93_13595 [Streptomyces sp. NPDC088745]|uniref:hypothetical protein n=1 Tax=Streptomyces sp. NPDC088745 TaxID=3365884 RepID=UPI00380992C2